MSIRNKDLAAIVIFGYAAHRMSQQRVICAVFSVFNEHKEALMAVPKSKISNSRRGMRRAHDRLTAVNYVEDKDSGELRRQHHIDLKTGMYKGRQVLDPKD